MKNTDNLFNAFVEKIDHLSVRERYIIAATSITVIVLATYLLIIEPMILRVVEIRQEINTLELSQSEAGSNLKILEIEYSVDPNKENRRRLKELTHQLRRIEGDIESKSQHLVPNTRTAEMLQEILASQKGLYMRSLEKMAPITVPITDGDSREMQEALVTNLAEEISTDNLEHVRALIAGVDKSDSFLQNIQSKGSVYRHGVKIELDGKFLDVLEYIMALESMKWRVYWKSFHYQTSNYPNGRASFVIETLGFDNRWIGV